MPSATFEDFWRIESRPREDGAIIMARMVDIIQSIPVQDTPGATKRADAVSGLQEAFRRVAWIAWLDGRLSRDHDHHEIPATAPGQVVYVAADPADLKRKLASIGRTVSGLLRNALKIDEIVQRLDELTEDQSENADELLERIRQVALRVTELEREPSRRSPSPKTKRSTHARK